MSSSVFQNLDSNRDGFVSKREWSDKLASFAGYDIIKDQQFSDLSKSIGLDLCPSQYYAIMDSSLPTCGCSGFHDVYIYKNDDKKCSVDSSVLFKKYAAQDWWGLKDSDKMSEDEFKVMVKELNDPCRA